MSGVSKGITWSFLAVQTLPGCSLSGLHRQSKSSSSLCISAGQFHPRCIPAMGRIQLSLWFQAYRSSSLFVSIVQSDSGDVTHSKTKSWSTWVSLRSECSGVQTQPLITLAMHDAQQPSRHECLRSTPFSSAASWMYWPSATEIVNVPEGVLSVTLYVGVFVWCVYS